MRRYTKASEGGARSRSVPSPEPANRGGLGATTTRTRSIAMPTTGQKPGKGTYKCRNCGRTVTLDDDTDTLPPCPGCAGTEFDKVG